MSLEKKKDIIILSHWLEIGGAERSLIGLLNCIDYSEYNVDLFLCRHTGELMDSIPKEVNLLPEIPQAAAIAKPIKMLVPHLGLYGVIVGRVFAKILSKIYSMGSKETGDNNVVIDYTHKMVIPFVPQINKKKEYDFAISFLAPHYLGIKKIRAKKRAAWIHTDYQNVIIDVKSERKVWDKYEYIIAISDKCSENFMNKFGKLNSNIICIENILVPSNIKALAEEKIDINIEPNSDVICSVGRFCYPKNFENIPKICKILNKNGYFVKWYLIGYGQDEDLIKQKIREEHMEEHVIILGKKDNPYPYIKYCDIYVQPSRYEGKAVTVREAQILGKPVIITNFSTAKSQVEDGYDGIIAPLDNQGCAKAIMALLDDKKMQEKLSRNCLNNNYGNEDEINKLYRIME